MAKVVCEGCGTAYKYEIAKGMKVCAVCGRALWDESNEDTEKADNPSQNEVLSFGEGVELGENDSFDEDKIDFWWYEIREPGTLGETDKGDVTKICAKCGQLAGGALYPIAITGDYLLMNPRYHGKCNSCGNKMKNHILSKRSADWEDPRKREMWAKDYEGVPKCPICSSTKIHKISMTNKAASATVFGVFAVGHVSKTYKCDICGAEF